MMNKKRLLALLLAVVLVVGLVPNVWATEGETTETTVETTVESTEASSETTEATDPSDATEPTGGLIDKLVDGVKDLLTGDSTEATEESTEAAADETVASALFEELMAAESVEAMYVIVLNYMQNEPEKLNALTSEEIAALRVRIDELDPEGDDTDTEDLLDTLAILPNGGEELEGDPELLADLNASTDVTWSGNVTYSSGTTTWTFSNGATAYLKAPCTVKNGATLRIVGHGSVARYKDNKSALIIVEQGGKLIIEGNSEAEQLVIDGKDIIATASLIISSGELNFKNAVIQNGKNRSVYAEGHKNAGKPNGQGGGITVGTTGSLYMENCVVTKNTASLNGGGIYSGGPVTIKNSEISWNRAMSSETGDGVVNAGRGGGFAFAGSTSTSTLENVTITENAAMYYGGGGQISGGASLTMSGTTVFSNNDALLHGAGGLHVTGDAIFTMNGGRIENNTAQTVGGGIHSSYSCTLNLNSGSISNNTANGRGGGVHVNTGGAITLGSGLTISGNKAYDQATGSYADVDAKGDNWSNVKAEGPHLNNGYGGGVLIDSGTCTVAGATISGNYAVSGGGGIALTMLNMSDGGLDDFMIVGFNMTSGTVSGNTTAGDGAGVYMMSNKAKENIIRIFGAENSTGYKEAIEKIRTKNRHVGEGKEYASVDVMLSGIPTAEVSGGTIRGNIATNDGGGLYLDRNTKFIIGGTGDISNNTAIDGAGVYIASGTAEINGGTITGNNASSEGGAIYVSGTVTMTDGEIKSNGAVENGGAVYVAGGSITMEGGTVSNNTAINGAGAYVTGGEFDMISGSLLNNIASSHGGGAYVHGGSITIGVKDCEATGEKHSVTHTSLAHPVVEKNDASFGGGLAADGGVINIYCGKVITNTADNAGMGENIFMYDQNTTDEDKPVLNHINGTVGEEENHGMVVIGGKMNIPYKEGQLKITIKYHDNGEDLTFNVWVGEAPEEYFLNLPYCPQEWETTQNGNGFTFVGWTYDTKTTAPPVQDDVDLSFIRDKEDYKALGDPVKIRKEEWKKLESDGYYIDFYAVWAPLTNSVTYDIDLNNYGNADDDLGKAMTDAQKNGNTTSYAFSQTVPATITMTNPEIAGYEFKGWRITPSKDKISNWSVVSNATDETVFYAVGTTSGTANLAGYGYEYKGGKFILTTDRNFGDIKLTAVFEEQTAEYTYILVGPETATGFGTLTAKDASESYANVTQNKQYTVKIGKVTGNPGTATAEASYGFKLKDPNGWFTDEAGTTDVDSSWVANGVLTPGKVDDLYQGGTFYAVIDYHLADLIISKTATGSFSKDQTFIFQVCQGDTLLTTVALQADESVTIKDLTIGTTYTVKEVGSWSWRFDATEKYHTMVPVTDAGSNPNTVAFTNTQLTNLWLTHDTSVLNERNGN